MSIANADKGRTLGVAVERAGDQVQIMLTTKGRGTSRLLITRQQARVLASELLHLSEQQRDALRDRVLRHDFGDEGDQT